MQKKVTPAESKTAESEPRTGQRPLDGSAHARASAGVDADFQKAVESGEIDGDVVFVDEQGEEIKSAEPRRTIFDP